MKRRITFSLDEELVKRVREKLALEGKTLNQHLREFLERLAHDDYFEKNPGCTLDDWLKTL